MSKGKDTMTPERWAYLKALGVRPKFTEMTYPLHHITAEDGRYIIRPKLMRHMRRAGLISARAQKRLRVRELKQRLAV